MLCPCDDEEGAGAAVRCPATFLLLFCFRFFLQVPSTNLKPLNSSTPRLLLCLHVAGCNLCGRALQTPWVRGVAPTLAVPCHGPAVPCSGLLWEGWRCP